MDLLLKAITAIVSGILGPIMQAWQLNRQIGARINEKARADTAESFAQGQIEARDAEAAMIVAASKARAESAANATNNLTRW